MNKENHEFNNLVMREIGLDVDCENHIVDEETSTPITMKGKYLKLNEENGIFRTSRNEINFDPLANSRLMNYLFAYYSSKLESEGEAGVDVSYNTAGPDDKQILKVKRGNTQLESDPYFNESVRYMDIITKINDSDNDVSSYDSRPIMKPVAKKPRKKSSK